MKKDIKESPMYKPEWEEIIEKAIDEKIISPSRIQARLGYSYPMSCKIVAELVNFEYVNFKKETNVYEVLISKNEYDLIKLNRMSKLWFVNDIDKINFVDDKEFSMPPAEHNRAVNLYKNFIANLEKYQDRNIIAMSSINPLSDLFEYYDENSELFIRRFNAITIEEVFDTLKKIYCSCYVFVIEYDSSMTDIPITISNQHNYNRCLAWMKSEWLRHAFRVTVFYI